MKNNEKTSVAEEELYLAPQPNEIANAEAIAFAADHTPRNAYEIFCARSDKELLLTEIARVGGEIEETNTESGDIVVKLTNEQLAAIKTLSCVERVQVYDAASPLDAEIPASADAAAFAMPRSATVTGNGGDSMYLATPVFYNIWYNGSIDCPYEQRWYRFVASASGLHTVSTNGSLDTIGVLFDSCGNQIAYGDDANCSLNFEISANLNAGETYYVRVTAYSGSVGAYELCISCAAYDFENEFASAVPLTLGQWQEASFDCSYESKWFSFTAYANGVHMVSSAGTVGTVGALFDANGNLLASGDNGNSLNFDVSANLSYGETYYVRVSEYTGASGAYDVCVNYVPSDFGNQIGNGTPLTIGYWKGDSIPCPCEERWYRFVAKENGVHVISTRGRLDTVGTLYDANGTQIASNDNGNGSTNFQISARLNIGDLYYICVRENDYDVGDFRIRVHHLTDMFANAFSGATPLDMGRWQSASFGCPGEEHWYKLQYGTSTYTIKSDGDLGTIAYLYDETGELISKDEDPGDNLNFKMVERLNYEDTYYLCVKTKGYSVGNYRVLSINQIFVEEILLGETEVALYTGNEFDLNWSVSPADATVWQPYWTSSDTDVVTVDQHGTLRAIGAGTACVSATAQDGSGCSVCCIVTVYLPIPVESIILSEEQAILSMSDTFSLTATISPGNAYVPSIVWQSSDDTVATVDSNGVVTAISDGITFISASVGNVTSPACKIRVDSRPCVSILPDYPDTDFNKVYFESSGKTWHCVDHDLIFQSDYWNLQQLQERADLNCREADEWEFMYEDGLKEYTDDELCLLYAIDPFGVAYYIEWYSRNGLGAHRTLSDMIAYKDQKFRLLFNREPLYYARNNFDSWVVTTDKSNVQTVLSESELYFGMHPVYDCYTMHEYALLLFDIVLSLVGGVVNNWATNKIIKGILLFSIRAIGTTKELLTSGVANATLDATLEAALQNTEMNWIDSIRSWSSTYNTLGALAEAMTVDTNFYPSYIQYVAKDVRYRVFVRYGNSYIEMTDLHDAIQALNG